MTTFTVPLSTPIAADADDNDEIEFEGTFAQRLEGDICCDRLRIYAEVVERCDRVVLDVEEDKVRTLEGTYSEPQVALASACDPCGRTETLVSRTSECDPCGTSRVTTVGYTEPGYRRAYISNDRDRDDDHDDVEVEIDDDGEVEIDD